VQGRCTTGLRSPLRSHNAARRLPYFRDQRLSPDTQDVPLGFYSLARLRGSNARHPSLDWSEGSADPSHPSLWRIRRGYSASNRERSSPDWRTMECSVPGRSSLWSGTGTVMVESSILPFLHHDMTAALPNLRETMPSEDCTDLLTRQPGQPRQRPRPPE